MVGPHIRDEGRRHLLTLAALAGLAVLLACRNDSPGSGPDMTEPLGDGGRPLRTELLSAVGACIHGTLQSFVTRATALETTTANLAAGPDPATREAARTAFKEALDIWQTAEVMQVGPAGRPAAQPGGQGLRYEIYAWPEATPCTVDDALVSRAWESPTFATDLVTRRGLAALDYLLFYEGDATECPATSPIVAGGTWAALGPEDRQARRQAYAAAAAADLRAQATKLANAWDPAQGNFVAALESAGNGSAIFRSQQQALSAVANGLLYLDLEVKDKKLARPLGLRDCTTATCPQYLESRFSHLSKANLRANLVGFRRIVEGCQEGFAGIGFDDLLRAIGAETVVAIPLERAIADSEAKLAAIEEPDLDGALEADRPSVEALHGALKGITDLLKGEFRTVLNLEVLGPMETDND